MYPPCMVWCGVSRSVVSSSLRLSGSSVHRTLQTRILEGIVIPFSRVSSYPRDRTWFSCIASRFITTSAKRVGSSIYSRYTMKYLSIMTTLYVVSTSLWELRVTVCVSPNLSDKKLGWWILVWYFFWKGNQLQISKMVVNKVERGILLCIVNQ